MIPVIAMGTPPSSWHRARRQRTGVQGPRPRGRILRRIDLPGKHQVHREKWRVSAASRHGSSNDPGHRYLLVPARPATGRESGNAKVRRLAHSGGPGESARTRGKWPTSAISRRDVLALFRVTETPARRGCFGSNICRRRAHRREPERGAIRYTRRSRTFEPRRQFEFVELTKK